MPVGLEIRTLRGHQNPWLALASHNYRLFFWGQLVSQTGRWLQNVGQAWLVLDLTGSALALGTMAVLQFAPSLALSLFAGALVDRLPKRYLLMVLQAAASVFAFALAVLVLAGQVQLWQVYVLALLQGIVQAIDSPTGQALIGEMVDRDRVQSAVGLHSSVVNAARIFGPALGGVIIASWGTGWCFALNTVGYGVGFAALAAMRQDWLAPAGPALLGRLRTQVADGLRYVASDRELLVPLVLLGVIAAIGLNWQVALPLLARYTFLSGATGFGVLNAAVGGGSLVGALIVASRPPARAVPLCGVAVMFSIVLLGVAGAPAFALAVLAMTLAGAFGVLFSTGVNAFVQLRSKPELRARVLSVYFLVWNGGVPIGGAMTASVAAAWDIRVALALNAGICLLASMFAIVYLRNLLASGERRNSDG